MPFVENLSPLMFVERFRNSTHHVSDTLLQSFTNSMSNSSCGESELEASCRDESKALLLKFIAIASILTAGIIGIAIPLVGKKRKFLKTDGNLFFAAKAFAAGVILATGFVHMLTDGSEALTDSCLPTWPWKKFPFAGFFTMMASLVTLLVDFLGTQLYQKKQEKKKMTNNCGTNVVVNEYGSEIIPVDEREEPLLVKSGNGNANKVFGEEEGGGMHIVGIHAHAAHHRHSHPHGKHGCNGGHVEEEEKEEEEEVGHAGHVHGFSSGDVEGGMRHVVVSQVLELGIVSHSVIIGLSLGVSQSPCAIRPLIAALSFHQFFEGFALGGCISQAQFKTLSATMMACFFAITTPIGICVGIGVSSFYNPDSARALIIEGTLDCLSAGILIYMALVDLIAADFMSKRMRCNVRLQAISYIALFLGASLMASLAIWA